MKPQDLTPEHLPFKTQHPSANGKICIVRSEQMLKTWKRGMLRWTDAIMVTAKHSDPVDYVVLCKDFAAEEMRIEELTNTIEGKHAKRMKNFNH